ncbi:uncharacterized protein LOC111252073 isoform X1 [Varroa destructor]|uniref:Uncharacterized protein n=1 Tax=Varroa destructor TaxID=109461 RepID=A0A7M7KF05_VARDE|nr:uncharacterized protein LOC111252073 isoform X1 [Varroa destructor]
MRPFFILLPIAVIKVCSIKHVVAVDGPTKPSEVYVLQYAPSEVLSSGPHNEENTAEDETDDIDSDGSGSPELDVNQIFRHLINPSGVRLAEKQNVHQVGKETDNSPLTEIEPPNDLDGYDDDLQKVTAREKVLRFFHNIHTPKEKNQGTSTISDYLTQWSPEDADNHAEENLLLIPRSNRFDGQMRPVDQQEQDGLLDRPFSGISEDAKTGDVAIVFVPIWREIEKTVYFALKQPAETATSDDDDTSDSFPDVHAILMIIFGSTSTFVLMFTILRTVQGRRERAQFSHDKSLLFSPPAYIQPPQVTNPATKKSNMKDILERSDV